MMNNKTFAKKAKAIAQNKKTLYVMGSFGAPLRDSQKQRYIDAYKYNQSPKRKALIMAADKNTFAFDCVGLIKGILWGWSGDDAIYGGAKYASNGVPDIGADAMIKKCSNLSTNFNSIEIGEAVWKKGHIGIYIGNGLAVECTPSWKDGVQITAVNKAKTGYKTRQWTKHGKLPYVEYKAEKETSTAQPVTYRKGQKLSLVKEPVYYSSADKKPVLNITGTYYIYDGVRINGKYRITNKKQYVGKKPTYKYVTAWIGG